MKRLYMIIIIVLLGFQINLFAQDGGVSIGKGDADADPSAILELVSTNKGLLIPRLSSGEREGIVSPATGLLVYDTTLSGFYYWTGSSWKAISGINSSSGTIFPASGGEGDLFYNTTESVLYTYVEGAWRSVGSNKQILNLDNTTLRLLEDGMEGGSEVDLSVLFQELSLNGTTLSISNGNSVDLGIFTGAGQTLSLDGTILTITNGNSVDFTSLLGGDMLKSVYDVNDNNSVDNAERVNGLTVETSVPEGAVFTDSQTLSVSGDTLSIMGGNSILLPAGNATGTSGGDMTKSVYDVGNNGKVDDAEKVNGLTVGTSVPTGAVFTDEQNLSEVLSSGTSAGGNQITNLGSPVNSTDAATKLYVDNSVAGFEEKSEKNIAGGYVGLGTDGKIDQNYLPSGITLGTVYTVANQTAQDALTPVSGDVAIRTDESKTYVYNGSDWLELQNPTGSVTSVSGRTGVVTLSKNDVGLNNVDNTSDVNKPVSTATQSALDLKANTSDLGTAAIEDVGTGGGNVVQLDVSGRLPAVDGSQLTNLPGAPVTSVNSQTGDITLGKSDVGLGNVDNTSDLNKPVSTATQTALDLKEDKTNKNIAGGYVGLESDGKINQNYLPSGVNLGTVYTVGSQTEQNALSASSGDVAVRTDESKTYVYNGSSWVELQNPTDAVTSVNGQTGVVSLTTAEVSSSANKNYVTDAQSIVLGNTSGINTGDQDISGIAANAANISTNTNNITTNTNAIAGLGTASGEDVGTSAGNVVQLDGSGKLPAVDGSQLTNLPSSPVTSVNGETGDVSLSSSEIGYDNATSGLSSTDVKSALDELATGAAGGDMTKIVYDTNGNSKVDEADNAATVNGLTVGTSVPTGAVFTDEQNLSEVLSSGTSAGGNQITNLGSPVNSTDAATKLYVDNSVAGFEEKSEKNIAGGYVGLGTDGKIDQNYLPSGITLGTVYTVANQTAQDALTPVSGDVAIRTDESKTYVYNGSDWLELQNPTGSVTSVSGRTGVVTLSKNDVGLENVDNTSDVNKPVSTATQSALDLKANTSDLGTAATEDVGTGGGNVVQLDISGRLPAVDGSQLTNLPAAPVTSVNSQTGDITLGKSDVGLGNVDNTSDLNKPVSTATQTALDLKEDKTNKNIAGGYVGLESDGKINQNYLPSGVNLGTVYTVGSQTEQNALSASSGDVAVRTDESKTYVYNGSSWVELQNPTDAVTSVNGQTGVVSLTTAEVSSSANKNYVTDAQSIVLGNTSGINTGDQDISGIAANAANISTNTNNITTNTNAIAGLGTASGEDVGTSAGNVVQLDGSGKLPAVDGSQLTNLPSSPVTSVNGETGDVSLSSSEIGYDNATSGLSSTDVKSALDELATGAAGGDMTKIVYDTNGNSKVDEADNAATVNGLTVGTSVPTDAVFTDEQNLSEVLSSGTSAGGNQITNLGSPVNSTDAATKLYVDNSVAGFEEKSEKNIAGGYVGLETSGKIDLNYLPAGINLSTVYSVADQTAQDALTPVSGDVAIRTDESKTYVYDGSNWLELQTPTGEVTSVSGRTGVVTLSKNDVGLNNVDNTSDVNKPVSTATQSALDLKANTSDLGTAAIEDVGTGGGNVVQLDVSGRLPAVDGSQLTNLPGAPVTSVNSQTGDITLGKSDVGLGNVDNTSDLNKPVSTATQTALDLKEDKTNKNIAGGYVGLESDGKINQNYLPAGINLSTVYTVANQAAQDALAPISGDVAIRTDESKTYVYNGSSWVELQNPTDAVTSVNGKTGVVNLTTAEVTSSTDKNYVTDAQSIVLGNTSGINTGDQDISGIAANAANISTNTNNITTNTNAIAGLGTASGEDVGTSAGNVVQLDGSGKLPAVDGSQLTNLPSSPVTSVNGETGDVSLSSSEIGYDNATSGLSSTDVKSALDELATGAAGGDMTKIVYDTNGNSKVDEADNAATVNGLTVGTSVPTDAVFTDEQNLSEVLSSGTSAGGNQITNLGSPVNSTDAATKLYVDNSVAGFEEKSEKNIAGGYVGLGTDGKIDQNYLPSGITLGTVYTVANQTAQDALTPVSGDVAIRTDESKTYVYNGSDWLELQNPTGSVTSVSGRTGVVTLSKNDVGLENVDNTSDVNKPVSTATQSALDLKANTSDLGTAAIEDVGTGGGNVVQLDVSGRLPAVDGSQLTNLPGAPVTSVNSQTGDITLGKSDVGLGNVDNTSDLNKPVSTATQTALDLKEDKTNKNIAGGYVGLESDGKINQNYLPSGVNLGTVYTVGSQTEQNALSASSGDVAVRTDESKTYVYNGSSWVELQNPTDAVTSVNGQTGVVSLTTAEVSSSANKNYVTDAQSIVLGNTSGINTGDQDISGIATNAANIATNTADIALKEDLSNKSIDIAADAASDIKYPTVKAIKDYVDTEIANVSVPDISNLATKGELADSTAQVRSEIPDVSGLATTGELADSTAQVRSEIPDVSGLATTTALTDSVSNVRGELADSTAQVRSEIPDVSGLATTGELADSTAQVRSEIPDVSGLATTTALTDSVSNVRGELADSTAQVRSEIPDVSGLATTGELADSTAQVRSEIPDVSGLATTTALTDSVSNVRGELADSTAQVRSEIPDVSGLATTGELADSTAQVRSEIPDVSGLATTTALTDSVSNVRGELADSTAQVRSEIPDVSGLATTGELADSTAQVRSEIPDVSGLATTTALTDSVSNVRGELADSTAQVRSEIPDVSGLATTGELADSTAQVRSEIPDVSGLATTTALTDSVSNVRGELADSTAQVRSEIPDVSGLATTGELADSTAQVRSEIPDVSGLATTTALTDSVSNVRGELADSTAQVRSEIPDVSGLATTGELADSTAQVRSEIPDVSGLATTTALTDSVSNVRGELADSTAQVRSEIPDVSGLATTGELADSTAQVRSEIPDVSGLATTTALTDSVSNVRGELADSTAQVRSEIPDVSGLATTGELADSTAQVRSEIPDVSGLATTTALTDSVSNVRGELADSTAQVRSEIPDVSGLATTGELADSTAQVRSEIPDVSGLATTTALTDSVSNVRGELADSTAQVRSEIPDVSGLATTGELADSTAQVRSEIPDVSGLATTTALTDSVSNVRGELADSTAQVRSEIPDVSGLATTGELADSTAQVRSEIPDVSGLATTTALTDSVSNVRGELADSTAQVRSEIPDVSGLATTGELADSTAQVRSEIPDVSGLATTTALTDSVSNVRGELADSTAQVRSEIPDVSGLATTGELADSTAQVRSEIPDVSGLATTTALTDSVSNVRGELADSTAQVRSEIPDVSGLATTGELADSTAQVRSEIPDVSGLATTTALTDSVSNVRGELADSTAQVRSEIPDVSGLATTGELADSTAQVRSEIPDVSGLATTTALTDSVSNVRGELADSTAQVRSEIPDVSGLATTGELADSTAQVRSEIPDVSGLATTTALTDSVSNVRGELADSTAQVRSEIPDVSGLATTGELADSTAQVRSEIPDVSGLATTTALTDSVSNVRGELADSTAQVRSEIPDVSGFATTGELADSTAQVRTELADSIAQVRSEIPNGTAASEDVGTGAGNVVQLDGDGKLPAIDGSQLTNLPSGTLGSSVAGALPSTTGGMLYIDENGDLQQDADFTWDPVSNKLYVSGAIDPIYFSAYDASNNGAFYEAKDGQNAAVSLPNSGRLRYNALTQKWQISENGGTYTDLIGTSDLEAYVDTTALGAYVDTTTFNAALDAKVDTSLIRKGTEIGYTLYWDGSSWSESASLTNIGDTISISSNLKVGVPTISHIVMDGGDVAIADDVEINGDLWVDGILNTPSDERLKKNITTLTGVLDKLNRLRGVTYEFKDQQKYATGPQIGVVAQELQKAFPELVSKGADGYLAVNYSQLSAVILQAVKEQQQEIEQLQRQMKEVMKKLGMN